MPRLAVLWACGMAGAVLLIRATPARTSLSPIGKALVVLMGPVSLALALVMTVIGWE